MYIPPHSDRDLQCFAMQVLARFEGFPSKKLEALRMAAALYSKLDAMSNELQNWKIVAPLAQLLDKVERYFNKVSFGFSDTNHYLHRSLHFHD